METAPDKANRILLRAKKVHVAIGAGAAAAICGIAALFPRNLVDFSIYYIAGQSLLNGRVDLYSPTFGGSGTMDYRYPPFFVMTLTPLWLLGPRAAAYLWSIAGLLIALLCFWLCVTASEAPKEARTWIVLLLVTGQFYIVVLHYGNAQLLVTGLLFGAAYLWMRQRDWWAGVLMALAITIKPTPVLVLPYFALKRRWKTLISTGLFVVLFNLAPAAYFGLSENVGLLAEWYRHVVAHQQFHELNGPVNVSIKGQMVRAMTHVDYSARLDGDTSYRNVNVVSWSYSEVGNAWRALEVGFYLLGLGFLWLLVRTQPHSSALPETGSIAALEIGLAVCLMLLAEPLTSKIYLIALLWPVAALAGVMKARPELGLKWVGYGIGLAAFISAGLPLLPGRANQRLLLVLGADFYLTVLITAMVGYSLFALRRMTRVSAVSRQMPAP